MWRAVGAHLTEPMAADADVPRTDRRALAQFEHAWVAPGASRLGLPAPSPPLVLTNQRPARASLCPPSAPATALAYLQRRPLRGWRRRTGKQVVAARLASRTDAVARRQSSL